MADHEPIDDLRDTLVAAGWRTFDEAFGELADPARELAGEHPAHRRGELVSPSLADLIKRKLRLEHPAVLDLDAKSLRLIGYYLGHEAPNQKLASELAGLSRAVLDLTKEVLAHDDANPRSPIAWRLYPPNHEPAAEAGRHFMARTCRQLGDLRRAMDRIQTTVRERLGLPIDFMNAGPERVADEVVRLLAEAAEVRS